MPAGNPALTSRTAAAQDGAPSPGSPTTGAVPEAHRIDEEFLGRSRGNLADYAIRMGKSHAVAARELRNIASISARDPRYISAIDAGGRGLVAPKSPAQIVMGFRTAVSQLEAMGMTALPQAMRARAAVARRVAMSAQGSVKQIAILSDALAQDLYAAGAPKSSYAFGVVSGQAVDRLASARVQIGVQIRKIELR